MLSLTPSLLLPWGKTKSNKRFISTGSLDNSNNRKGQIFPHPSIVKNWGVKKNFIKSFLVKKVKNWDNSKPPLPYIEIYGTKVRVLAFGDREVRWWGVVFPKLNFR